MNPGGQGPPQPEGAKVKPSAGKLNGMNASATQNASKAVKGVLPCEKKLSWFAIRIANEKNEVIEGLTLKLVIPDHGEIDRLSSKGTDPIKIEELEPGGTGSLKFIEGGDVVFEAIGDFS